MTDTQYSIHIAHHLRCVVIEARVILNAQCECVCVCVCAFVYVRLGVYVCARACMLDCMRACVSVCVRVSLCVWLHAYVVCLPGLMCGECISPHTHAYTNTNKTHKYTHMC